jgi:hypothetical protein
MPTGMSAKGPEEGRLALSADRDCKERDPLRIPFPGCATAAVNRHSFAGFGVASYKQAYSSTSQPR